MNIQAVLSRERIEAIASRVFSARDWVTRFGIPTYHLRDNNVIRKSYLAQRLPEEWEVVLFGRRFYVFLSRDKVINTEAISQIKLSPSHIKLILETDFSKKGVQRNLSKLLTCSESQVSRVRRGLQRTNFTTARKILEAEKETLFLNRKEVQSFFGMMLTVKEFFENHGPRYKIKTLQNIYHMSSNRKYFSLPHDWHSIRVGNSWLVYNQDLSDSLT